MDVFKKDYMYSLRMMLFVLIPSLFGLIALREPLCSVLFERGEFTSREVVMTAQAVLGYAVGHWAIGGLRITVPAFYALKDTKTPVIIAFVAFIINIIMGYTLGLYFSLHQLGLALASSISAIVNFILLAYILNRRTGAIFDRIFVDYVIKIVILSLLMGLIAWKAAEYVIWFDGRSSVNFIYLALIILGSFVFYVGLSKILRIEEIEHLREMISRRK